MLAFMGDLAAVDPVLQHQIQRAPGQRLAAPVPAGAACPGLAADATGVELLLQEAYRAECGITPENVPDRLGLAVNGDQFVIAACVAERRQAAHPHTLLFRGGDLVADALAGDLAL